MPPALDSAGTADRLGLLTCGEVSAHNWDAETMRRPCGDHVEGDLRRHRWIGVYSQRRKSYGG
jgi:hypothetical protein